MDQVGQFRPGYEAGYSISRPSDMHQFHQGLSADPDFWPQKAKVPPPLAAKANEIVTKPHWDYGPDIVWYLKHRGGRDLEKYGVYSYLNEMPPNVLPTKEQALNFLKGTAAEFKNLNYGDVATDFVVGAAMTALMIGATGGLGAIPVAMITIARFGLADAVVNVVGQFGEKILTRMGVDPVLAQNMVKAIRFPFSYKGLYDTGLEWFGKIGK